MTRITTIYDALHAHCVTTFPNHTELVNPYFPELNDDITFSSAWGLTILPMENGLEYLDCYTSLVRTFNLSLTKKIYSGPIRSGASIQHRKLKEKELLEEQFLFIKSIESNVTLDGNSEINKILIQSDSGLEFLRSERVDLILINTIFSVQYFEKND